MAAEFLKWRRRSSAVVQAERATRLLSLREFQKLCSYLDASEGKTALFEVVKVQREAGGALREATVRLFKDPKEVKLKLSPEGEWSRKQ